MFGKTVGQRRKTASTPVSHKLTRPGLPQTSRPFLRAKIIKSYVYLSVILWYPTLQVSFALFTVLNSRFFVGYSLLVVFLVSFFVFFGQNYFFASWGDSFKYTRTVSTRIPHENQSIIVSYWHLSI